MSRRVHKAPLALTSDGDVLLNVAMFDHVRRADEIFALALRERGEVFIGVVLRGKDVRFAVDELHHAHRSTAAWFVGGRQQEHRRREGPAKK